MPARTLALTAPDDFKLRSVAMSHGWFDLPPFEWDQSKCHLQFAAMIEDAATDVAITENNGQLRVRYSEGPKPADVRRIVTTVLGLNLEIGDFYESAGPDYTWAKEEGLGRFLRAPSM